MMFRKLLAPRSVIIVLLTGGLVASGGYAWAQTTAQPETVVACTFNRVLFLADATTQKCSIGKRVDLVTTAYQDFAQLADLKSRVVALENKLESEVGALESKVGALEAKAGALESEVGALQVKLSKVSFDPTGLNGLPTLKIDGANLQVVSGSTATDGPVNGLGNLFIGYDENPDGFDQTGSHNLILGNRHTFTSYGGLIAGRLNKLLAPYSSVSGGRENSASASSSSVSGGADNTASGFASSVSGGDDNTASGSGSSVSGGAENTASGTVSSVSGGELNAASGFASSMSGGFSSTASGFASSVSGGFSNTASGFASSILGGQNVVVTTDVGTSP